MQIERTIYNPNLLPPDGYTVECAGKRQNFKKGEEAALRDWMLEIWRGEEDQTFPEFSVFSTAYIFFNIDWDSDHILYAKYRRIS